MADEKQQDRRGIVLADGRELRLDLNSLTWREVRELMTVGVTPAQDDAERDAREWRYADLLGQAVGLSAEEMLALGFEDFRCIERKVAGFIRDPVGADPN